MTTARVIDGAVLVAAKLHSGRETDLRDVLAVTEGIDLDAVTPHLRRGDDDALREQLERGLETVESDKLKHGYRSDFGASYGRLYRFTGISSNRRGAPSWHRTVSDPSVPPAGAGMAARPYSRTSSTSSSATPV